ncbi:MAG: L-seryl-tRNA selenium transferase, partial [Gemmatimonadetes bacterium]|nr:L-seryl-tRNA selenium transferase [Gemmatimonadota bacterium]
MDVYQELGVEPIINAAGTLTRMSGSIMHPQVVDAMVAASKHFVMMNELHEAAGRRVAELIGVPAAHVCACATAGIAIMAAAVMAGNDPLRARQLPDTD